MRSDDRIVPQLDLDRVRKEAMNFADVGIYRYRFNGEIVFMDRVCLRLLDLEDSLNDPAEVVGKDISTLLEYIDEPRRLRSATREHSSVRNYEYHFRTLSGKERWSYHNSYLVTDPESGEEMLQVIVQNITQLKQTIKALEESEKRYRTLAEQSAQGIFVIELASARILFANQAMADIGECTVDELLEYTGDDIWARIHPEDLPMMRQHYQKRLTGDAPGGDYEVRFLKKDGSVRWVAMAVSVIEFEGTRASQATVTDITRKKEEAEQQLKQERHMLHVQKLESLGVLAGGVAHDFNNLLAVVMGNAELASHMLGEESVATPHLRDIVTASTQASQLCRQLLAYTGRGPVTTQLVNLDELLEQMLPLLKISISKKVALGRQRHSSLPSMLADGSQVNQIVLNLITNASEAIGDKPGRIHIETGVEHLSSEALARLPLGQELAEGKYVFLEVRDDGEGMDAATVGRIFDPFFSTKFTGRGLGLASVLGIIRSHDGAYDLTSKPGVGTNFRVYLPASKESSERESLSDEKEESLTWQTSGCVLLADDEPMVLDTAAAILTCFGFEVITATDGEDAVEKFHRNAERISVVILDATMPRKSGLEAYREIRLAVSSVPVLFASGYDESDVIGEIDDPERTDFISKPYSMSKLEQSLKSLLPND